jgi:hypothetical protein
MRLPLLEIRKESAGRTGRFEARGDAGVLWFGWGPPREMPGIFYGRNPG